MAYHLLSSKGTAQNENKFRTQKPTPFNDPGTIPVRCRSSVPFEKRNEPIAVMIDEPPKPRPRTDIIRRRKRVDSRKQRNNKKQ